MKNYAGPAIQIYSLNQTQDLITTSGEGSDIDLIDGMWDFSLKD